MIEMLRVLAGAYRAPPAAGASPEAPSLFDFIRLQALVHEESRRLRDLLFERLIAPAPREADDAATSTGDDELAGILRRAQLLLLKHPIAAQAAFAGLIAEGRRFAATPEGAEWSAALAGSELVHQGRRVWDAVSLNMLEDNPGTIIPSTYLEALLRAARAADLEGLLARLHDAPRAGERDGAVR